jgi:hypothetical protein
MSVCVCVLRGVATKIKKKIPSHHCCCSRIIFSSAAVDDDVDYNCWNELAESISESHSLLIKCVVVVVGQSLLTNDCD